MLGVRMLDEYEIRQFLCSKYVVVGEGSRFTSTVLCTATATVLVLAVPVPRKILDKVATLLLVT